MDQNRNATGYLTDIELALHQGLVDAIFKGQTELSGARLRVLLKWLEVRFLFECVFVCLCVCVFVCSCVVFRSPATA